MSIIERFHCNCASEVKQLSLVIVEMNQMGGVSVQRQLQGKLAISRYLKVLAGQGISWQVKGSRGGCSLQGVEANGRPGTRH